LPFYVYCTVPLDGLVPGQPLGPVVFTEAEFASRAQAIEMIARTQQLLTAFEPDPEVVEPAWEVVEAESLEAAKAQVALLGRPLSPN
jgi:hypothetical protein